MNAFNVFRKDDAVVRALQGSQVALHEYRMAYDNLLQVATADRDDWSKQKIAMEDDLRALAIRNSEAERLFKVRYDNIWPGLQCDSDCKKICSMQRPQPPEPDPHDLTIHVD